MPAETTRYPVTHPVAAPLVLGDARLLPVAPLRVYTCGITPYAVTHVGHAATFVWADVLASVARAAGAQPVLARNVTDVDDVLTAAAARAGEPYDELAVVQEFQFDRDMTALSVARPAQSPHARGHVPAVVRLAAALLDVGAAYEHEGHVYFDGSAVPARAGLDEETALRLSTEYGDQDSVPGRRSPFDVAVWRPSGEDQPAWPSPWGWGRPGWHAECAAMAAASLGHAIDVLVGGVSGTVRYFSPYPSYFANGQGAHATDIDDNTLIDHFLCGATLLLGHRHPALIEAQQRAAAGLESGVTAHHNQF